MNQEQTRQNTVSQKKTNPPPHVKMPSSSHYSSSSHAKPSTTTTTTTSHRKYSSKYLNTTTTHASSTTTMSHQQQQQQQPYHQTSSPQKQQYYLIRDTVTEKPNDNYFKQSWQEPFIIEDEDLMFDGTPLGELHEQSSRAEEEMLRSRRSSGESERSLVWREEMSRGRQRDRS